MTHDNETTRAVALMKAFNSFRVELDAILKELSGAYAKADRAEARLARVRAYCGAVPNGLFAAETVLKLMETDE